MIDLGPQPNLRSDRLRLTPFAASDAASVFAYAKNPRVSEHTTWTPPQSLSDTEAFIKMVQNYETEFCWAIRLEVDGPAHGAIEFGFNEEDIGSVHYVLAEQLWNLGLMTEAIRTVLDWAFDSFAFLERVETGAASANLGSRRVLEKCGFELTGFIKENWTKFDEPVESASYALNRAKWAERAKS